MTSFCVQYLAESKPEPEGEVIGSVFLHEQTLPTAEECASSLAAQFADAMAFRILDMGGGVHLFRTLGEEMRVSRA
jgi:hypothetical protein